MLFQSTDFIFVFLPIVFFGYLLLQIAGAMKLAKFWLACASLYFYGHWKLAYLPILAGSIVFNYLCGLLLQNKSIGKRSLIMWVGISANIGLLFFFKYFDFFTITVNSSLGTNFSTLSVLLPLGISFFTFQNIAFLVDAKNDLAYERNLIDYALFISFFPQLIAGPIVHHKEMMPQFKSRFKIDLNAIYLGIFVFAMGLFKKVGVADTFSVWADQAFSKTAQLGVLEAWAGSIAYTFQLYFDFSGYTDMAIGLGLLFGIKLPENFQSPFKSTSIVDFWQRWHMSLTQFIMGYIYMPMVRWFKEINTAKILLVTLVSMTIIGLWHGANWTFVVFGFFHGMGLVINNLWRNAKLPMPKIVGWLLTFVFVNIGFVIFRAETLGAAYNLIAAMFGNATLVLPQSLIVSVPMLHILGAVPGNWFENLGALHQKFCMLTIVGFGLVVFCKNSKQLRENANMSWGTAFAMTLLVVLCSNILISAANPAKFLYFNF